MSISSEREHGEAETTTKMNDLRQKLQSSMTELKANGETLEKQEKELVTLRKENKELEAQLLFSRDKQEVRDRK
eukprot:3170910-Pyramimonas_sp.AAC.1